MRSSGVLALRPALGGSLAAQGAQKLFGRVDGFGTDQAAVAVATAMPPAPPAQVRAQDMTHAAAK